MKCSITKNKNTHKRTILQLLVFTLVLLFIMVVTSGCESPTIGESSEQNDPPDTTMSLEEEIQEQSDALENAMAIDGNDTTVGIQLETTTTGETTQAGQMTTQTDVQAPIKEKETSTSTKAASTSKAQVTTKAQVATKTQAATKTTKAAASTTSTTAAPKPAESKTITVSLSVNCVNAVNADVPGSATYEPNGNIVSNKSITLDKGSSVYDALKKSGLVINASNSAGSIYIVGIQGIQQGAAGKGAGGWIYSVNSKFPQTSASRYELSDGDVIAFHYTVKSGDVPGSPY